MEDEDLAEEVARLYGFDVSEVMYHYKFDEEHGGYVGLLSIAGT